jgi:hypothetical protein
MKRALTLSLLMINLLLPPAAFGQLGQQKGSQLVVSLPQGGFAAFKIEVSPLTRASSFRKQPGILAPFVSRVVMGEGNVLHRLLVDEQGRFVFAYDLVIIESDSPRQFGVSARALDPNFEQSLRADDPDAFQSAPDSSLPTLTHASEQQTVADGETVALDLLINEPLGVKVVDYVTVASERSRLAPSRPSRPPRDFGVSNVELAIRNYQLFINELPVVTSGLHNCTGAMVWFYLAGRGRFIFSLVPYEGYDFRKVGVIEDNKISFKWKGASYEWVSREPIVGSGGVWNLWVLHDQDFVDIFARPVTIKETKVAKRRGGIFRQPKGAMATIPLPPFKSKAEDTTLESHRSAAKQSPERVRVVVGGAKTIEALLPKK